MNIPHVAAHVTVERGYAESSIDLERPTRQEIARLAYHFYEARGRRDGYELEDWFAAEQELIHHYR